MYRYLYIGTLELSSYSLINASAFFVAIACNLLTYRHVCLPHTKRKNATLILICACQIGLGALCNSLVGTITPGVVANYFGTAMISPFLIALVLILMRLNPLRHLDRFTPSYALVLVVFKIACFMHGCCEGKPTKFGLYYPYNGQYEFPSQLLEAFVALIIFFVLLHLARRQRRAPGLMFPLYLILYSATRFFTEFTRANEPVIWQLQPYHLFCLAGVLLGVLEWVVLSKYGAKLDKYFEQRF